MAARGARNEPLQLVMMAAFISLDTSAASDGNERGIEATMCVWTTLDTGRSRSLLFLQLQRVITSGTVNVRQLSDTKRLN